MTPDGYPTPQPTPQRPDLFDLATVAVIVLGVLALVVIGLKMGAS